jgi:16S rRNA processing protein RimM
LNDLYLIAEVIDIHNTDGSVIIKSFSDFSERFLELEKIVIDFFGKNRELDIEFAENIDNKIILKFRRFNSEEDVLFLIGKKLYINKQNLFNLPDNSFYIHDLLDCEVYLESSFFGKLIDVLKLPGNDVYVVQKDSGKEVMIPAVEKFIDFLSIDEKKIFLTQECKLLDED